MKARSLFSIAIQIICFMALVLGLMSFEADSAVSNVKAKHWQTYETTAEKIQEDIKQADFSTIAHSANTLVNQSKPLLTDFLSLHPECKSYINAVLNAADTMKELSLDTIEADYHADGKLPKVQHSDCYHAKDLLVHPATVLVMAKKLADTPENRNKMAHELTEVLMHFNQVKQASM